MKKNEKSKISEEKQNEFKNLENQLKRALADYQNLERRIAEEKSSWVKTANKQLLLKILPVLDDLFLAQKHLNDDGLGLTIQKFIQILKQEGVTLMQPLKGAKFDPKLMEALGTVEGEEGRVIEEVRSGYTLFGQVLRPAQVVVGKQQN